MLVEAVEPERRGRTLALAMSVITCGTVTGPAISGTMFQLAGYWAAWSVPLALLGLDSIARLAMIEKSASEQSLPNKTEETLDTPEPHESQSLLTNPAHNYETTPQTPLHPAKDRQGTIRSLAPSFRDPWSDEELTPLSLPSPSFYRTMLLNPGVLAGLANTLAQALIVAAFDTTLPAFLRYTFGWGSMPVGLIFLGLQGPIIVLGPVVGGLRDKVGCKIPTVIGWGVVAPFLLLLAMAGRPEFGWAAVSGFWGEVLVVGCISGVGLGFLLIRGGGGFQVIGMAVILPLAFGSFDFADFVCSRRKGAGRPGSGPFRSQWGEF